MQGRARQFQRADIEIKGLIQGVGFRPFIYQLATELNLTGLVRNTTSGVQVVVEGSLANLELFVERLNREKPTHALIEEVTAAFSAADGRVGFRIEASEAVGHIQTPVLPDLATCSACLRELHDPSDRRFRYPFINCIHCGPRYTIIDAMPFDRERTAMRNFILCDPCQREYEDPGNRRFHAQATACSDCGPELQLWDKTGRPMATRDEALQLAIEAITDGKIVAMKGLGGFHIMTDAGNEQAVAELRRRKRRAAKPFAVMYPTLAAIEQDAFLSKQERALLNSPIAPIVLLRRRSCARVAPSIAPENPNLGILLPYTPLHQLFMEALQRPVLATSGNVSEEPLCIDEHDALRRLGNIADLFLVHDRPIRRPVDDSIMRIVLDEEQVLRRARGLAPFPFPVVQPIKNAIAVGGHLKNTVSLGLGSHLVCSQHHGDLETLSSFQAFEQSLADLAQLYQCEPERMVADLHPDYRTTQHARRTEYDQTFVQHHYAHVLAGMADNRLQAPVLGVAWDGGGYGDDGTIWGGEFLQVSPVSYHRVAHLRRFRLPGGEAAVREPKRSLFGLLYEWDPRCSLLEEYFSKRERDLYGKMIEQNLNAPMTSSIGRVFDAVAALFGICEMNSFEGQAAMSLEFATEDQAEDNPYDFELRDQDGLLELDWRAMVEALLHDRLMGEPVTHVADRFHATLVEFIVAVAERIGERRIVLTGGCFQNAVLTERAVIRLRESGFEPYWHHLIPPNDGGLSVGQLMALQAEEG